MWEWSDKLKLGKMSAFVKRDLRLLPLTDAEFEADFFLDRGFSTKRREAWIGMVIEREFGALLAMEDVEWPPTVNDLATLLAHAMFRAESNGYSVMRLADDGTIQISGFRKQSDYTWTS